MPAANMLSFPFETTKPPPVAVLVVIELTGRVIIEGAASIGNLLQPLKSSNKKPDKISPAQSSFTLFICFISEAKVNKKALRLCKAFNL